jgi:hypothetical protein
MKIDLEQKCSATHRWELVARFEYCAQAIQAAIALSALDGSTYRVTDKRWPEDPASPHVSIFTNGEVAA